MVAIFLIETQFIAKTVFQILSWRGDQSDKEALLPFAERVSQKEKLAPHGSIFFSFAGAALKNDDKFTWD